MVAEVKPSQLPTALEHWGKQCSVSLLSSLLQCLEVFSRGIQGSSVTVYGMLQTADVTRSAIASLRKEDRFRKVSSQDLDPQAADSVAEKPVAGRENCG